MDHSQWFSCHEDVEKCWESRRCPILSVSSHRDHPRSYGTEIYKQIPQLLAKKEEYDIVTANIYHPKWSHMHIPSWLFFFHPWLPTIFATDTSDSVTACFHASCGAHNVWRNRIHERIVHLFIIFWHLKWDTLWKSSNFVFLSKNSQSGSADETLPLGCSRVNRPERGAVGTYWDHVGIGTDCEAGKEAIFHWGNQR